MSTICDDLRAAILQAAMQGKLTKREPNDDNAEELYGKIIKEHSAFKPNKFVEKDCDEAIIPEEWSSLKTGEAFELITGEKVANGEDLPLLDAKYFRGKQFSKTNKGNLANRNDVLILVDGENSGETFLCTEPGYMGSTFKGLFIPSCINRDFALYFLEMNRKTLRDNKRGAAIPHLDKKLFFNFIFPIPSFAEQKRIVEKVDELMARVADLEKSTDTLASLRKAFPDDIKASLLQAAMQGKLTKQLPEDGNAEELLEEIKAEKEKLISEGKIKKQKPLASITDDEIPFNIPDGWKWSKLGEMVTVLGGKRIPAGKKLTKNNTGHIYIRVSDMKDNTVSTNDLQYVPEDIYPGISRYIINKDDVYITVAGTIGRVGKIPPELDGANLTENADRLVFNRIDQDWLIWCLNSPIIQNQIHDATTQVGQPKLAIKRIEELLIPLPPLTEQKRIVERLENLMQNINTVGDLIASE